ncbi:AsmA-like C-terminal domain-containing protein, partial [Mariprofundus ferrooxydans]|nr:AsmA-like C-terminal domain-containing protein [Mariprofundus ferrooxydans]
SRLLQWFGSDQGSDWQWNKARANSRFELLWDPSQASPSEARASLRPDGTWNIHVFKFPIQVSQGEVQWDLNKGLSLKGMHINSEHMHGIFSLTASPENDAWSISSLQAKGSGELAQLAAHFQLPIAHAAGKIRSSLRYDGQRWFGDLDMTQASWEHLLGSDKKAGEIFSLQYEGELDMPSNLNATDTQDLNTAHNKQLPTIHLNKLSTTGQHIKLRDGAISINQAGLKAQLNGIHTPSFSGNLDIDVPFDDSMAWKIDAKATYLNRNALPETLDHPEKLLDKTWLLRADIDRFDWGDAHMSGVHLKLSSDKDSLGIMEAAQIHTSQLDILDVDARFTLPGQGQVELRKFSATFEKQQLTMSATLKPISDGGMRWTGFAELHGDFGHLMNVSDLSKRFLDGDAHLLFSGQGVILKEQPWWQGLDGRLRMRVDHGRVLEGGTFTTLLSAINIARLPALLLGLRNDLTGPGIMYERLQMEAIMQNQSIRVRNVAMRSSAFDLAGQGSIDVDKNTIDLYLIAKPLQNLDAILSKIPLVRDLLGGRAHSLVRKVYHLVGPFNNAKVESVQPQDAGLAEPGIIERFLSLPSHWFGSAKKDQ